MTKIILHPMFRGLSGKLGDVVFRYGRNGETTVSKIPDMTNVKWSKAQKAHRRRFKKAVAYAKTAMAEPNVWALYQEIAAKKHKRPWDLAISDYFQGNDLVSKK
jgi:hypothetical protein